MWLSAQVTAAIYAQKMRDGEFVVIFSAWFWHSIAANADIMKKAFKCLKECFGLKGPRDNRVVWRKVVGKCFVGDVLSEAVSTSVPYHFQMGADCISLNKKQKNEIHDLLHILRLHVPCENRKRLAHKCHTPDQRDHGDDWRVKRDRIMGQGNVKNTVNLLCHAYLTKLLVCTAKCWQ